MRINRLCKQCERGKAPADTATFNPQCPGCQRKLAEGKRTGLEPHPREMFRKYRPQVRYRGRKAA